MLKELKRIIISKATLAILILLIIAMFVLFGIQGHYGSSSESICFKSYTSFDELRTRITTLEEEIEEIKKEKFDNSDKIEVLRDEIRVSEFLIENKIDYNYLEKNVAETGVKSFSIDVVDYAIFFGYIAVAALVIIMIVISIISLNLDFTTGTARLLYALKKRRSKILDNKYLGYLSATGIFALIFTFIIIMVGIPYKTKFSQILIVDATNVYLINTNAYFAICIISQILLLLFFSTVIFSISMFVRGVYASTFINIIFLAAYLIGGYTATGWFASFFAELMSYHFLSVNFELFIVLYIIRSVLAASFFIIARKRFLTRDIY
ncbi:MAG: ABC transporter permease subunit [Christensenellaceae bacterium]|nr:ABC transporter permease subunit [Christensenellaceae bacterium]